MQHDTANGAAVRVEDLVVVGGVAGEVGRSEVEDHLARFYAVGFQRVHIADDDLCSLLIAPLRFSSKKDAQKRWRSEIASRSVGTNRQNYRQIKYRGHVTP
jgi:hypothetical protein